MEAVLGDLFQLLKPLLQGLPLIFNIIEVQHRRPNDEEQVIERRPPGASASSAVVIPDRHGEVGLALRCKGGRNEPAEARDNS